LSKGFFRVVKNDNAWVGEPYRVYELQYARPGRSYRVIFRAKKEFIEEIIEKLQEAIKGE